MKNFSSSKFSLSLAFLAGLCYNGWLLGIWLNPKMTETKLLSALDALNQPYHEVFILLDILSSFLILILVAGLTFEIKKRRKHFPPLLNYLFLCLAAFALTTILAAVFAPPTADFEEGIPNPFLYPLDFLHDGLSVLALIFMASSLILGLFLFKSSFLALLTGVYCVTLILSSIEGIFPGSVGPLGQQINTVLTAIWIFKMTWQLKREFLLASPERT